MVIHETINKTPSIEVKACAAQHIYRKAILTLVFIWLKTAHRKNSNNLLYAAVLYVAAPLQTFDVVYAT